MARAAGRPDAARQAGAASQSAAAVKAGAAVRRGAAGTAGAGRWRALLLWAGLAACAPGRVPPPAQGPAAPEASAAAAATATLAVTATAAAAGSEAPAPVAEEPAERFDPSWPVEVPVSGDLVALAAHAAAGNRRAIVYLHGVCGDVTKYRAWAAAAVRFGTVVAVRGDDKCKEPGRYKWGFGVERTDRRLQAALRAVGEARGAPLDSEAVTLVGYSQGSSRAEELVRAFPARYRRAVLVAGPHEHAASSFRGALAIAVVAGEKDLKTHLQESAAKAAKAGVRARYFELPGARHGDYGQSGEQVMGDALAWVFADAGPAPGR